MVGRNSSEGQVPVVQLLRSLGKGHRLLMQYKSAEAVEAFNLLPCQHHQTPWVLTQMGKAHFEMVNYNEARYFFEWSLEQDPNRVEGLEWYSTVLWHMKKEVRCLNGDLGRDFVLGCFAFSAAAGRGRTSDAVGVLHGQASTGDFLGCVVLLCDSGMFRLRGGIGAAAKAAGIYHLLWLV